MLTAHFCGLWRVVGIAALITALKEKRGRNCGPAFTDSTAAL